MIYNKIHYFTPQNIKCSHGSAKPNRIGSSLSNLESMISGSKDSIKNFYTLHNQNVFQVRGKEYSIRPVSKVQLFHYSSTSYIF